MDIRISTYRPFAVNFFERQFGSSSILNRLRIPNVEVALEGLGEEPPELCRSLRILLVAHDHKGLDQHRHLFRIFAGRLRAFLEFRFMLLPCVGICAESIAILARAIHRLRSDIRWHQQRHISNGRIVKLRVNVKVLSAMNYLLTSPHLPDDFRCFHEPFGTFGPLWPGADRGLLVQRLSRADAEKYSSRVQQVQRGKGLGNDCGVVAESRTSHCRPDPDALRAFTERGHRYPSLSGVTFVRLPGLQMIAGGE